MKNKAINILISFLIFIMTCLVFIFANKTSESFLETLMFIMVIILPSLFPFMIFINFILLSNCIDYLAIIFKPIGKIFKLSGYGISCVIASLLGGFPYSAILVSNFLKENKISKQEAERLIISTFFPSISFLFVSLNSLDEKFIYIIISLYLSSFLVLYLTSFMKRYKSNFVKEKIINVNNNFTNLYFDVMKSSFSSIFSIAFCIIFFKTISTTISYFISDDWINKIISGILEFSSTSITILSQTEKGFFDYLLLMNIISFSSFSIIFQSLFYLKDSKIGLKKLLFSRITICLISSIIFMIMYALFFV